MTLSIRAIFILLISPPLQCTEKANITLLPAAQALHYTGEKIVYIGVGTFTELASDQNVKTGTGDYKVGRWQYLPTFMRNYIKTNPSECACLNFDGAWEHGKITYMRQCLKDAALLPLVNQYPNLIRVSATYVESRRVASAEHNKATGDDYEETHLLGQIERYCEKVLQGGGVIIIGHFAALPHALEIIVLYNRLAKQYPDAICLIVFSHIWMAGAQFSLYEEAQLAAYAYFFDKDKGLMYKLIEHWNSSGKLPFPWNKILQSHLQGAYYPYRLLNNTWNKQYLSEQSRNAAQNLGYNRNVPFPPIEGFIHDLLQRSVKGGIIPPDPLFEIKMTTKKYTLVPITIDLLPFLRRVSDLSTFTKAVVEDLKRYQESINPSKKGDSNSTLNALQNELTLLSAYR